MARISQIESELKDNRNNFISPRELEGSQLRRDLAPHVAGFAVGDVVKDREGRKGQCVSLYTYSGTSYSGRVALYKKDGTLGSRIVTMGHYDKWELHDAQG